MKHAILVFYFVCCLSAFQYGQTVSNIVIGDFSLSQFQSKTAVVVVFTGSNCRFATQYVNRLNQLSRQFQQQNVGFVAINSNDPQLSPNDDGMKMKAVSVYDFPYVKDEQQRAAKAFNATSMPEAFVLKPLGGQFEVFYKGAIDDNPLDERMVSNQSLKNAIESVLKGTKPTDSKGMGCPIRFK